MLPLLNISMRAQVSTLRKVVMTGHAQPLMGRPGEWVLHTNILWICHNLLVPIFSDQSYIKSTHQVIQKNKVESQLFHISQVLKKLAFASPDASPGPGTDSPSPWTTQKKLGAQVFKLDVMETSNFWVGKDIQESESVFCCTTKSLSRFCWVHASHWLLQIKRVFATHPVIQNRTNSNLNLLFTWTIESPVSLALLTAKSAVFYTEPPISRSIQQPISRSRLFPRLRLKSHLHDITVFAEPGATHLRKAIPWSPACNEHLKSQSVRLFPMDGFLEVWWISSFAFFLCKDEKSSSNW